MRHSHWVALIVSFYILVAFTGASHAVSYNNPYVGFVSSCALAILATAWAIKDSETRTFTFHRSLGIVCIATYPFSILVYLAYSRHWWGLALFAIHFAAVFFVTFVTYMGLLYALYFAGFWQLLDPIHFEF